MKSIRSRLICIGILAAVSAFLLIPRAVVERAYDPSTGRVRDSTVRRVPIALGLDLRGGMHLALEVDRSRAAVADCREAIRAAERVVRARIDELGTTDPVVQVAGDCRLIVELPGVHDADRARAIVQRTAFLEFRVVDPRDQLRAAAPAMDRAAGHDGLLPELFRPGSAPGELLIPESRVVEAESLLVRPEIRRLVPRGLELRWGAQAIGEGREMVRPLYGVANRAIVTGAELRVATAGRDPMTTAPEVRFQLTNAGGTRFAEATGQNIGKGLAILLDGRVQGPPAGIQERIGASGRIKMTGRSLEEASDLALVLRAGALPVPLRVVEQASIGPSLGEDSIASGVQASILAVVLVFVVMGTYYGVAGLLAVGALLLYVLYSAAGLALSGFNLTLPGLAGFALSIGMAVDANVLIFERMREESARGQNPRQAVKAGFSQAMSAIVDSNVTTALTAVILHQFGTEAVRGFAVTLLIGLAASMLSAVFVTRTFFLIWLRWKPDRVPVNPNARRPFGNAAFDFIGVRRWAYGVTGALVVPAIVLIAAFGLTYGIEFTGGTLVQLRTPAPIETGALRAALEARGLPGAEVRAFGSPRDFVVRARLVDQTTAAGSMEVIETRVREALDSAVGADRYEVRRTEGVGPTVSGELQKKAVTAVLLSFGATMAYLAVRFEWRYGVAAVLATAHDIVATVAFIRYLDLEVSLIVVAAVLTVLGYSLNDTIVIFDRVRENRVLHPRLALADLLNRSVNETLPRTLLTGGTTLGTALVLAALGGEVIRPFALVMSFGIIVGTFSSIFVASPILLWVDRRWGIAR